MTTTYRRFIGRSATDPFGGIGIGPCDEKLKSPPQAPEFRTSLVAVFAMIVAA
jgi:hypothetical protein